MSAENRASTAGPEEDAGPRAWWGLAWFGAAAVLLAFADLWTKVLAFDLIRGRRIPVIDLGRVRFDLIMSTNEGAAFGMMQGALTFFLLVSVAALLVLAYFSWAGSGRLYQVTLGMVASGVLGNLHDRAKYGYVRDFLDVYLPGVYHWPTFNVADACITVGTIALLVKFVKDEKRERRRAEIREKNREHLERRGGRG